MRGRAAKRKHSNALCRASGEKTPQPVYSTQEDPIGLAGGMNLYGYAGGDPINNSDPFGLWIVAHGLQTNLAVSNLLAGSATFRGLYMTLLNAPRSEANIVIRPERGAGERANLAGLSFCDCAYAERDRGTPNGRIIFNGAFANNRGMLENWIGHEIAHTAGQFSELTGTASVCGAGHPSSNACVDEIESAIKAEMDAYRAKQEAAAKSEKKP